MSASEIRLLHTVRFLQIYSSGKWLQRVDLLLIQERAPKHTLILGPTYSEYSRELSFSGSTQEYYHLQEERNFTLDVDDLCKILEKGYDFLIICNPNNPTSSAIMQEDLRKLIAFCAEKIFLS